MVFQCFFIVSNVYFSPLQKLDFLLPQVFPRILIPNPFYGLEKYTTTTTTTNNNVNNNNNLYNYMELLLLL